MNPSFDYKGIPMLQPPNVADCFALLFKDRQPSLIIEIGTKHGGLTAMLEDICPEAEIHTYDIVNECPTRGRATYRLTDVFAAEVEIALLMAERRRAVVLCDGGNKIREFNVFAQYLKPGDQILAHDYYPCTCEWDWAEIGEADIARAVSDNKLKPYMWETMSAAAWCSYKRE